MALKEESKNLTTFITPLDLHNWKWHHKGLSYAQGAFQNLMESIYADLF